MLELQTPGILSLVFLKNEKEAAKVWNGRTCGLRTAHLKMPKHGKEKKRKKKEKRTTPENVKKESVSASINVSFAHFRDAVREGVWFKHDQNAGTTGCEGRQYAGEWRVLFLSAWPIEQTRPKRDSWGFGLRSVSLLASGQLHISSAHPAALIFSTSRRTKLQHGEGRLTAVHFAKKEKKAKKKCLLAFSKKWLDFPSWECI